MSIVRLLVDEDAMDRRFIQALRMRGIDVSTVQELGTNSASDTEQLLLATQLGRVFYTFNASDFYQLHSLYLNREQTHSGIIISTQNYSIGEQMRRILKLIATQSAEDMINQCVFLSAYAEE